MHNAVVTTDMLMCGNKNKHSAIIRHAKLQISLHDWYRRHARLFHVEAFQLNMLGMCKAKSWTWAAEEPALRSDHSQRRAVIQAR